MCEECVDGERRDVGEWSAGNKGHHDHNGQLNPLNHGDDGHGNGSGQSSLVLLLLSQVCCSSVAAVVDVCVVAVAAVVDVVGAAVAVEVVVDAAAAVDAAAVSLRTSPTDYPDLLHYLLQTLQH